MRLTTFGAGVALVCLAMVPVHADQRGRGAGHAPSGPKTTQGPTSHGPAAKGPTAKGPSTKGPTSKGPSTHTTGSPTGKGGQAANAPGQTKKSGQTTTTASTTTANTTTSATGTTTTTSTIDFTAGPVGQRLSKNTALTSKLETRLAALGYEGTVYQAAYGFKNLGQFVAATNVSQNLGIPFEQLKLQMTGLSVAPDGTIMKANLAPDGSIMLVDPADATTPAPTKSLGQSIHAIDTTADSDAASQTATTQANIEIEQ